MASLTTFQASNGSPSARRLGACVADAREDRGPPIACVQPWVPDDPHLIETLRSIVASGRLSNHGPHTTALEVALTDWLGQEVIAIASCSLALELGLEAMQPERRQRRGVVLPACTYVATLNAVQRMGYEPVFCDIDPDTWTLAADALSELLQKRSDVDVVLPVNVYGVPPNLARIRTLADHVGARVLYDNAHGLGTRSAGVLAPRGAHLTAWSMHATKVLPAGEGGLLSSDDGPIMETVRRLRNHGIAGDPLSTVIGTNGKLSEMHAAVAHTSFRQLPAILGWRQSHLHRLRALLREVAPHRLQLQHIPADVACNGQNLTALVIDDAGLPSSVLATQWIADLAEMGVEARRYFWPPLHHLHRVQPQTAALPVTDAVMPAMVCLPLHSRMPDATLTRLEHVLTKTLRALSPTARTEGA